MNHYELLYIIPAKYTEAEIDALTEKVSGVVSAAGAKVTETHQLGKRKLAYPINNVRHGTYVMSYVEAEADVMSKLDQTLRLSTDVLRHLLIERDPKIKEIPSLVETPDERRGERGERRSDRREAPRSQRTAKKSDMSMEELDKKLDKILTEEVL